MTPTALLPLACVTGRVSWLARSRRAARLPTECVHARTLFTIDIPRNFNSRPTSHCRKDAVTLCGSIGTLL